MPRTSTRSLTTFDGGGFAVKGLYLKDKDSLSYGLFGTIENAKIQNLGVTDSFVNITRESGWCIASIVGQSLNSTVENCYNTAKVIGYGSVGGVVGVASSSSTVNSGSTVKNCYNTGEIKGDRYVGGIIGQSTAKIQDCYNTGSISGNERVGGIAGMSTENQNNGDITAIIRCYNIGDVSSNNGAASGIVGMTWVDRYSAWVDNCISLGLSVQSQTACRVATGNGTISNAYARADMTVNDKTVSNGTLTNSNGQNLVVSKNTAQDWSTWFGSGAASAWNFPTDGKLWFGAQLPTLKSVGGTQNPTLPGTGSESDSTPPTLAAGAVNRTSETTATVKFTSNDGGIYYYNIGSAVTNTSTGGKAFSAGEITINLTNLTVGAADIYIVAKDTAGNLSVATFKITIPAYVSSDIAAINNAKAAAEGAIYRNMTQAVSTSEDIIKNALKETATTAINDNSVTVIINKVSYTEPIAGTLANPSGINGNYVFTITVSKGGQTQTTMQKTITITATPYKAVPTYDITGTVKDKNSNNVFGAKVKLMKGKTPVGSQVTTDVNGKFTILGVQNGIYNLVVSKDDITVTTIIIVNNENNALISAITLPIGKTNSIVEVMPNTPDVVVGGLDELFGRTVTDNNKGFTADDKNLVETNGGSVTIKLTAQSTDNTAPNANDINTVAKSNTKTIGAFMDFTVSKTATDSSNEKIFSQSAILVELPTLIEVHIPLAAELQSKTGYVIYRYHGSNVDEITTNPNAEGEYFTVETDTITLHIKKFSTYAIAYTTPSIPPDNNTGGGSGGHNSSSVEPSTITTEPSEGGKTTMSDDEKIATITPNDGYVIADVMVDGKSVGATGKYTFTDSNTHKITALFVKKTELPYYIQNDEKIYIGFSAITEKLYKYIAPHDIGVEFKENPKHFTDNTIAWAKPSIDFVTEREIFLGTTQDKFGPNDDMTRAMFVTAIGRLYERSYGSISGTSTFSDVDANDYYAKYVAWANENGIIKGIGENKFAPKEKVTREQMAVIMQNFANLLKKADVKDGSLAYADSAKISTWAIDGAKYCQETKVITGRNEGNFAPQESATRAEVAAVIERFIKTIVK